MTRKDYILVADIIVEQLQKLYPPDSGALHLDNRLVEPATRILSASSASFDPQKFRDYILKKLNR